MRSKDCKLRIVLAASLLWVAGDRAPAAGDGTSPGEEALRYTLDPAGVPIYTMGQKMTLADAPPPGVKLPPLVSDRPRFLTATVGDGTETTFFFAVDESERGAGYNVLYADGNHNKDLTDDRPARFTRWGWTRGFKPVRLLIELEGRRVQYHVSVATYEGPKAPVYTLQSWGYYSGEARFGEKTYPVAVVDYNANGRFNDLFKGYGEGEAGDVMLVDLNRDGKFEQGEFASPELHYCARCVQVDGRYYKLAVSADGTGVTATPAAGRLATLRSDYERFALMLGSEHGMLILRSESGSAEVPIGEYRLLGWQIEQREKDGSVWLAQGTRGRDGNEAPALSVKADTPLPRLASPLRAKLNVQSSAGRDIEFALNFTAESGQTISNVLRNGRRIPEPRLKVLDAQGREVGNVPFHYG